MNDSLKRRSEGPLVQNAAQSPKVSADKTLQSFHATSGTLEERKSHMPERILRKVSYISAYLMLRPGETALDMGCENSEATYMLALLNPDSKIIGIDKDPDRIKKAEQKYRLPNLAFRVGDITNPDFPESSVDAIVNSNILHEVYSATNYNTRSVVKSLESQRKILKPGGRLLIRDFIMPAEEEYVQLELPATQSTGTAPLDLSDADLLISFSQTSRPRDPYNRGFYLEELPPHKKGTRLFRLLHKWALEFIYRKNYRGIWMSELNKEYTFFTYQDFKRELAELGMRTVYSAPYRNPWIVENCYENKFRLYSDQGQSMDYPPTNFFILAQKVSERQSLILQERRPSQAPFESLSLKKVTDKKTGKIYDIVSIPGEYCDVVPYRETEDGRLLVYAIEGHPRPLVNAVPRGSANLDGKRWSGHLIEPMRMDTTAFEDNVDANINRVKEFLADRVGLEMSMSENLLMGPPFYPAPHMIEEKVESVFVEISKIVELNKAFYEEGSGFSSCGTVREFDAEHLLRAAQVGLLPEARLELYIYALMNKLGRKPPAWIGTEQELKVTHEVPEGMLSVEEFLESYEEDQDVVFEDTKKEERDGGDEAGGVRPTRSVFVDEGQVDGALAGLASQDIEFISPALSESSNIAVVMPLMRAFSDEIVAGFQMEYLPVPDRLEGEKRPVANLPMIPLPKDIENIQQAKEHVALKFGVRPDMISQLGESYFIHIGVTPQRVYPFIMPPPKKNVKHNSWIYAPIKNLWHLSDGWLLKTIGYVMMKNFAEVHGRMVGHNELAMDFKMAPVHTPAAAPEVREGSLASRLIRTTPKLEASVSMPAANPPVPQISKSPSRMAGLDFSSAMKRGLPQGADIKITPAAPDKPQLVAKRAPADTPAPKPSWDIRPSGPKPKDD